ncbi:DNA N-6-adenine-methyltransferase [Lactococcus formosensis subsp. bovis]|uniref:DNA N-6-adenine-methyltransferase n=1 Tax=Lactococcus formosensis TaxID=1281486 RepID=UPI0027DC7D63|nr:DNA N-6-adenine-methyltransferase [Lactococcus formosensis]
MNKELMFSSKTDLWATPQDFFDKLNDEFHFTLDPCSTHENAKCYKHFTVEENGLLQDWGGEIVFCNPPYGRKIKDWVEKSYEESQKENTIVVMLIPARTDTIYFHEYIYHKAEIRFIKGRLKFGDAKNAAPFPSMIVIFKNNKLNK